MTVNDLREIAFEETRYAQMSGPGPHHLLRELEGEPFTLCGRPVRNKRNINNQRPRLERICPLCLSRKRSKVRKRKLTQSQLDTLLADVRNAVAEHAKANRWRADAFRALHGVNYPAVNQLFAEMWADGYTQAEIARLMGVTREAIRLRIEQAAR